MTPNAQPDNSVLSPRQSSLVDRLEEIIHYRFNNRTLAIQALTHPSAQEEAECLGSYERLEFLGDAYLGAFISELLYMRYPDLDEGGMTRIKITLVSGEALSNKAAELGLGELIIFGSSERGTGKRGLHSALENVFEAIIAAMALDGGHLIARQWVLDTLGETVSLDVAHKPENPKSRLQELYQMHQVTPTYRLVASDGPPHNRTFTSEVIVEGEVLAQGRGRSIKEAEAAAATKVLEDLDIQ